MAYYYRGIIYWMDGLKRTTHAPVSARARRIGRRNSTNGEYSGDYMLLDYLDGLATAKEGGDGSDAYERAKKNCENHRTSAAHTIRTRTCSSSLEFGPGPPKFAPLVPPSSGNCAFRVPASRRFYSAMITINNQTISEGFYDDLGFQATTRGGRVMDHVLANKAVFKDVTGRGGDRLQLWGGALTAASSRNSTQTEVGLGELAAGLVLEGFSASTHPAADTRAWDQSAALFSSFAAVRIASRPNIPRPSSFVTATATHEFRT